MTREWGYREIPYRYAITVHMVSSWDNFFCCFRGVKEDNLLANARYTGRFLYFANNLSGKMWRGIRIMPRRKIPHAPIGLADGWFWASCRGQNHNLLLFKKICPTLSVIIMDIMLNYCSELSYKLRIWDVWPKFFASLSFLYRFRGWGSHATTTDQEMAYRQRCANSRTLPRPAL